MPDNNSPILNKENIRSFGRIKYRTINDKKLFLINNLLPRISVDISKEIKIHKLFNSLEINKTVLEIGSGDGEFIAHMAKNNPNTGFIASEVFYNGIASLLTQIDNYDIKNIRIFNGDARLLIDKLPKNIIDSIFVLFPDPWPKNKHNKKRIINNKFLISCNKISSINSSIEIVTDHGNYAEWIENHIKNCPFLRRKKDSYFEKINFQTKYQKKAIEKAGNINIFSCDFI